ERRQERQQSLAEWYQAEHAEPDVPLWGTGRGCCEDRYRSQAGQRSQ
ncbi:MAG: hypothetical protein ACI9HI_001969, partial [Salinirussus sp.]